MAGAKVGGGGKGGAGGSGRCVLRVTQGTQAYELMVSLIMFFMMKMDS